MANKIMKTIQFPNSTDVYEVVDETARNNISKKQDTLVSGTNIKTINGVSLLGKGDITIQTSSTNTSEGVNKSFSGKVVSVLGDSISAMVGYIPVADGWNLKHDPQYPSNFGVDNMWWKIVINRLGAKLGICDAWDGTTVKNTATADSGKIGPNTYIGSSTRLINLKSNGTPDLILVYAGTNDTRSISTTSAGTFDATKEYVPMTEEELYTNTTPGNLAEAYTALIRKLQYLYPTAKIACICPAFGKPFALYPQGRAMALKIIRDVCDYFGALFIDPVKAGLNINNTYTGVTTYFKDGIHPNKDGMKLIGDYVYKQVVNTFEVVEGTNTVYSVKNLLSTLTTDTPQVVGVSKGTTYTAKLSGTTDFTGVTIYMGATNITSSALAADGTITITNVTGNITIADANIEPPTIQTYSVTFEENGGSQVSDLTNQTELPNPLPTTTRSGFTFNGWFIDSALTTQAVAGNTLTSNTTLYAKWTAIETGGETDGETGGGSSVIDPESAIWYVNAMPASGTAGFNYNSNFPGYGFASETTNNKLVGVPINAIQCYPSKAGVCYIAKATTATLANPVKVAEINFENSHLFASGPSFEETPITYSFPEFTLAEGEFMIFKLNETNSNQTGIKSTAGVWVIASGGTADNKSAVYKPTGLTAEGWPACIKVGYIAS